MVLIGIQALVPGAGLMGSTADGIRRITTGSRAEVQSALQTLLRVLLCRGLCIYWFYPFDSPLEVHSVQYCTLHDRPGRCSRSDLGTRWAWLVGYLLHQHFSVAVTDGKGLSMRWQSPTMSA